MGIAKKKTVYLLFYFKELSDGHDYTENIGVFSTQNRAAQVAKTLGTMMRFQDGLDQEGCYVEAYELNKTEWNEGYIKVC